MLDGNNSEKKISPDKDYEDVNIENLYDMIKKIKSDIKYTQDEYNSIKQLYDEYNKNMQI